MPQMNTDGQIVNCDCNSRLRFDQNLTRHFSVNAGSLHCCKRDAPRRLGSVEIPDVVPRMQMTVDRLRNASGQWKGSTVADDDYPEGVAVMGGSVATLVTLFGPENSNHAAPRVLSLPALRANMEQLGGMFKDFNVLVVSPTNKTALDLQGRQKSFVNYLNVWRAEASAGIAAIQGAHIRPYPVHVVYNESEIAPEPCESMSTTRICKITRGRNAALLVLEGAAFSSTQFVIMVDSDMCRQWALPNFAAAFAHRGPWVALTANGVGALSGSKSYFYQDSLAYRDLPINESTSLAARGLSIGPRNMKRLARQSKTAFHPEGRPIAVRSAFGGLGIYRMSALRGCRYGLGQCEHHDFHTCLSRKGNVLMFPHLVIEWTDPKGRLGRMDKECFDTWRSKSNGALIPRPPKAGDHEFAEYLKIENERNISYRVWKDFGQTCVNMAAEKCEALAKGGQWPVNSQAAAAVKATSIRHSVPAAIKKQGKKPDKKPDRKPLHPHSHADTSSRPLKDRFRKWLSSVVSSNPKGKAVGAASKSQ